MTKIEKLLPELSVIRAVMMTSKREAEILEALKAMREDTIEECARVVDEYWRNPAKSGSHYDAIAAAIRALKEKP